MTRFVRITCTPGMGAGNVEITDAESGAPIRGVADVTIHLPADGLVTATLEMLVEIDCTVEGTIRRLRLNQETGEYLPVESED